jgi:hypothetical protein
MFQICYIFEIFLSFYILIEPITKKSDHKTSKEKEPEKKDEKINIFFKFRLYFALLTVSKEVYELTEAKFPKG